MLLPTLTGSLEPGHEHTPSCQHVMTRQHQEETLRQFIPRGCQNTPASIRTMPCTGPVRLLLFALCSSGCCSLVPLFCITVKTICCSCNLNTPMAIMCWNCSCTICTAIFVGLTCLLTKDQGILTLQGLLQHGSLVLCRNGYENGKYMQGIAAKLDFSVKSQHIGTHLHMGIKHTQGILG